jgi:hypothetical protein
MRFQVFRGSWVSWDELFSQAAEFASDLGPSRVVNISHSESNSGNGVVTVWYWDEAAEDDREATSR